MNLEQMSLNQLCDLVRKLQQALTNSNLALMEQTELAERCRKQAEALEAERDRYKAEIIALYDRQREDGNTIAALRAAVAEKDEELAWHKESLSRHASKMKSLGEEVEVLRAAAPQQHAQAALSDDVMRALNDARALAMKNTAAARVPECGDFGAIAQNLDWVLSQIAASQQPAAAPSGATVVPEGWALVPRKMTDEQAKEVVYNINRKYKGNPMSDYLARAAWDWAIYAKPATAAPAIQQEGAVLDERYAGCLTTIRGLDKISMDLSAALIHLPIEEGSRKQNIDYVARQDILDLVVAWRTAWDKNSAQRQPIDRAALAAPAPVQPAQGDALSQRDMGSMEMAGYAPNQFSTAFKQGRASGIEEAAKMCDSQVFADGDTRAKAVTKGCAAAIRALNKQEPTA